MKDSSVLKRLSLLCSLLAATTLFCDELEEILSHNKRAIFEYDLKHGELESDKLSKSWINPVMLRYTKNYSTQFPGQTIRTGNYAVSIDQPIFRSGGIYYAIKYADAFRRSSRTEVALRRREMIADAVSILFQIEKNRLLRKKMRYQIKNDTIDIRQKRDSYGAGVLDSSFLDQAILKKSQDEASLLELELGRLELRQRFSLLSDKNPQKLKLPHLKLIEKARYKEAHLALRRDIYRAEERDYQAHMTRAKYLPSLSLQGQYTDGDLNPLWASGGVKEHYFNYGFSLSMPLDINSFADIEASRVARLRAAVEVLDRKESVDEEYDWVVNTLHILEKKIALAKKDEAVYGSLYRLTKNLAKAGEKTDLDVSVMYNSLQIRKLDQQIYDIERQIQLLKLYMRVENVL